MTKKPFEKSSHKFLSLQPNYKVPTHQWLSKNKYTCLNPTPPKSGPKSTLKLEVLGLFPGEDVPAEVTVAGGLLENGVLQLQVPGKKLWF